MYPANYPLKKPRKISQQSIGLDMTGNEGDSTHLASGKQGMVSSAHPLATEAGLTILRKEGNAFDASVAIAATLNVVEPMMSGIGGYGTILVHDAVQGKSSYVNSSDRIPRGVDSDLFRSPTISFEANRRGAMAVSTPGNVRAWLALSETYGKLRWGDLFKPAINLALNGFTINRHLSRFLQRDFAYFPTHAQEIYGHNGRPYQVGERLAQHDLARSLSQIAKKGPDTFYGGSIGRQIVSSVRAAGGFLAQVDLDQCVAEWWDPIRIPYRGHHICTASPPATSFAALIRLGLMSQFDVGSLGHNSPEMLHLFAEVTKHAYRCRLQYAADPEVETVPLAELLSPEYWRKVATRLNRREAEPFISLSEKPEYNQHTTHFVVADKEGNIVSATQTLGQAFGSRIMPTGTGIWLNNSLQYCTFEPKGNRMDAHAGRHKLSGDCPVIIYRDGIPWAALGTPGGHTIPQIVPQMAMNLIDFGMNMAQAIAQPRISFAEPDKLLVDAGLAAETKVKLAARGHSVQDYDEGYWNAHGLTIAYDGSKQPIYYSGAADPRGEGLARGL
ncbi:MAG: gamma-glutamyltransferase [Chloroflexi bacterium]|nr:gamma-glutamyltransferase [Chloroflexota bacterium]